LAPGLSGLSRYFGQYGRRIACDGQAIGLGGQGGSQNTTSGSVEPRILILTVTCEHDAIQNSAADRTLAYNFSAFPMLIVEFH